MIWKLFAAIFGGIGAILLLIALFFGISTQLFISQAEVANGTVISAASPNTTRRTVATISFTAANGQQVEFNSQVSSSPPEFTAGQRVLVYYDPANPAGSARPNSFLSLWFLPMLFGILGLVFFGVGTGFFMVWFSNWRKKKWLSGYGQRITARITGVRLNTHIRNMGKSPYNIMAEWQDPLNNYPHVFRSDNIWDLPPSLEPGQAINVLVDPNNYRRYYVEVQPATEQTGFNAFGSMQG